jgi:hypothetical protein
MRYRLPLELGLTILQLAAPPLVIDSSRDRVDFFIKTSLVHRSFTAWAQERLHDQFLYTYRPRPDEYECLKLRFEAGFGRNEREKRTSEGRFPICSCLPRRRVALSHFLLALESGLILNYARLVTRIHDRLGRWQRPPSRALSEPSPILSRRLHTNSADWSCLADKILLARLRNGAACTRSPGCYRLLTSASRPPRT